MYTVPIAGDNGAWTTVRVDRAVDRRTGRQGRKKDLACIMRRLNYFDSFGGNHDAIRDDSASLGLPICRVCKDTGTFLAPQCDELVQFDGWQCIVEHEELAIFGAKPHTARVLARSVAAKYANDADERSPHLFFRLDHTTNTENGSGAIVLRRMACGRVNK